MKNQGRNLVAKIRLARAIVEEGLYSEFKRELIFNRELQKGNLFPDESIFAEPVAKMEIFKLIIALDEFTIETLTVFGIMPFIGIWGQI